MQFYLLNYKTEIVFVINKRIQRMKYQELGIQAISS